MQQKWQPRPVLSSLHASTIASASEEDQEVDHTYEVLHFEANEEEGEGPVHGSQGNAVDGEQEATAGDVWEVEYIVSLVLIFVVFHISFEYMLTQGQKKDMLCNQGGCSVVLVIPDQQVP